jgi:hypothetical protein
MTQFVAKCHFCHKFLTEAQVVTVYDDATYCACLKCADAATIG